MTDILVAKIGGSTLGSHDTTLADIVELQRRGVWPVIVHRRRPLLENGVIPVIAPIAVQWEGERPTKQLLNINADTVAGDIASALVARWLVFLTDVPGVCSGAGDVLSQISADEAGKLIQSGVIEGGMIPKMEACLTAALAGC